MMIKQRELFYFRSVREATRGRGSDLTRNELRKAEFKAKVDLSFVYYMSEKRKREIV